MKYKKTTLPNGLRIITVPTKGNPAATVMVVAEAGSKYETKSENGLSHFIEHMCFKGTPTRPNSAHINKELDGLGAASNAMTGEEYTGYYAKAERKHWKKLLEIISDMYLHPLFPEDDLEKERGVIIQEIAMYEDRPQDKVGLAFHELLYGDTPAGRGIAGTKESVQKMARQSFFDYHKKHYVAKGTIVVVAGDIREIEVKKEVSKLFKDISTNKKFGKEKVREAQTKPALEVIQKKTDQTHMILGMRAYKASDKRSAALSVLGAILGGGMSSRLFQKLRDEMGVCYYVHAGVGDFTDHGYFYVATGVDNKRTEEVIDVVTKECKELTEIPVDEAELRRVKDYVVGNMYLRLETTNALASYYVSQEITEGQMKLPSIIEKEIRAVTSKDVLKVAKDIFRNEKLNLAVIGDIKNTDKLQKTLSF